MDILILYQAFNSNGAKVLEAAHTSGEWYDGEHPIIDNDEERVRMQVERIKGHQFEPDGSHHSTWENRYNSAGHLIDSHTWNAAGELIRRCVHEYSNTGECTGWHVWKADGSHEFITMHTIEEDGQ